MIPSICGGLLDDMNARYDALPEPRRLGVMLALVLPGLVANVAFQPWGMLVGLLWLGLLGLARMSWVGGGARRTRPAARPKPRLFPPVAMAARRAAALLRAGIRATRPPLAPRDVAPLLLGALASAFLLTVIGCMVWSATDDVRPAPTGAARGRAG
jgi:hypothetical protein